MPRNQNRGCNINNLFGQPKTKQHISFTTVHRMNATTTISRSTNSVSVSRSVSELLDTIRRAAGGQAQVRNSGGHQAYVTTWNPHNLCPELQCHLSVAHGETRQGRKQERPGQERAPTQPETGGRQDSGHVQPTDDLLALSGSPQKSTPPGMRPGAKTYSQSYQPKQLKNPLAYR